MASARSRCSSSCSARSSEPPNDGAVCASRSSNSDRSPLSEKNSTTNIMLQSRRWPGQPSPEFPANPSLDPAYRSASFSCAVNPTSLEKGSSHAQFNFEDHYGVVGGGCHDCF